MKKYNDGIYGSDLLNRLNKTLNSSHAIGGCIINKSDIKILLEYVDESLERRNKEVVYLCDRKECNSCVADYGYCYHTSHIEHAMNFERCGGTYFEKDKHDICKDKIEIKINVDMNGINELIHLLEEVRKLSSDE